jgi:alpha-tubulin suppressor-like RCC1 family protein
LALAGLVRAQGPNDPNEGSILRSGSSPGAFTFSWWGRPGRIYFVEGCDDLAAGVWTYEPVLETGSGGVVSWGFNTAAPQFFLRLKYTGTLPGSGYYGAPFGIAFTAGTDGNSHVRYTLDGSAPAIDSPAIEESFSPFQVGSRMRFKARFFIDGTPIGPVFNEDYLIRGRTLFAKGDFTVALAETGTTWVWGGNRVGGIGTATDLPCPQAGGSLEGIAGIGAGADHGLGFWNNGRMQSWGDNALGQLGNGTRNGALIPGDVTIPGESSGIRMLAAGEGFSVALTGSGNVYTWGDGSAGQLGVGDSTRWSLIPARVEGLPGIQFIAAGRATVYAIDDHGSLWAWGDNSYLQAGMSGATRVRVPGRLDVSGTVTAISGGTAHALALTSDGRVYSFGSNWYGQLGRTGTETVGEVEFAGGGISRPTIVEVAAGDYHSLALASDGIVYAWGAGWSGQNGDGGFSDTNTPVQILSCMIDIAGGRAHSVALGSDGIVYSWGDNANGQLGVSGTLSTAIPQPHDLQLLKTQ